MVKGLSDNIITNTVESINKIRIPNNSTNEQQTISSSGTKSPNGNTIQIITNSLDKDLMIDDVNILIEF